MNTVGKSGSILADSREYILDLQLFNAVAREDIALVNALLAKGAKPDRCFGDDQMTAIHLCCSGNSLCRIKSKQILELLIASQPNVNITNSAGESPLVCCCIQGDLECADILIRAGADVDAQSTYLRNTPLHWAADAGQRALVDLLIHAGANTEIRNRCGRRYNEALLSQRSDSNGRLP